MMHQSWNTREAFVAKAAEVMKFKIVYPEGAVLSEGDSDPFPPEFVHQVFGMRWVPLLDISIFAFVFGYNIRDD